MSNLSVGSILSNSFTLGFKNIFGLIGAIVLWILTIWIPYLNVGTTIGLYGLIVVISKGGIVSPTEIFKGEYRKFMGEFFLLAAFIFIGVITGYLFFIIPGIVIGIAWGQSVYLLLDKGYSPTQCISVSNKITYGEKWKIFGAYFILVIAFYILLGIGMYIFNSIIYSSISGIIYMVLIELIFIPVFFGAAAYIYSVLSKKLDAPE